MVFEHRRKILLKIRHDPSILPYLRTYYRDHIAQFIIDWGVTYDPRNVERKQPALVPFLLFPKQEEWVNWAIDLWRSGKSGLTDKSRDMGVSWLAVAVSVSLCIFNQGMTIGFGSRKAVYVDKLGDPKSLLYKVREFTKYLPTEFRGNWNEKKNAPYMKVNYPMTNSTITGEVGDQMARGGRFGLYFPDEAAFLSHPELIEASLSNATNCRIDISTPNGTDNPFYRKRFSGKISVMTMHWKDHPAKDEAWYEKVCAEIDDPVIIEQELNLGYSASKRNIIIPAIHVEAAIDAHIKLGIKPKGIRKLGMDVGDEGDLTALAGRHGIVLENLTSWSGKGDDIFGSVEKTFLFCDEYGYDRVDFDSDGIGASVRGDARVTNEKRTHKIEFNPFHGSGAVIDPEGDPYQFGHKQNDLIKGRTNDDYFLNLKAQSWWALRRRFHLTYRIITAIKKGESYQIENNRIIINSNWECDLDNIISLSSEIPDLRKLMIELSQPTYAPNNAGKMIVNKTPEGARSPNLADAVMIAFAPAQPESDMRVYII